MRLVEERGSLVGALVCEESDELFAVANDGVVIRTRVAEVRATGRDTMGVSLMGLSGDRSLVAVARAAEMDDDEDDEEGAEVSDPEIQAAADVASGAAISAAEGAANSLPEGVSESPAAMGDEIAGDNTESISPDTRDDSNEKPAE
jgi:DNA gyrase subunit A